MLMNILAAILFVAILAVTVYAGVMTYFYFQKGKGKHRAPITY